MPDPVWLNVGSGRHNAPAPWWNIDVAHSPEHGTIPDQVVDPVDPFGPWRDDNKAERMMLSHVLEHVPWRDVLTFTRHAKEALQVGGEMLVMGPDWRRTLELCLEGSVGWDLLDSVLEHAGGPADDSSFRHQWNCCEARTVEILEAAGLVAEPVPMDSARLEGWPVVVRSDWQFAILARHP